MITAEELMQYPHADYDFIPMKKSIPQTTFGFDERDRWNDIYRFCVANMVEDRHTARGYISHKRSVKFLDRYLVQNTNLYFSLTIISTEYGMYRFILKNRPSNVTVDNPITGIKALRELHNTADQFGVDLKKYAVGEELGWKIKQEIVSPKIEMIGSRCFVDTEDYNDMARIYHIDLNSAYFSALIRKYPEMTEMANYLYEHRKDNDGYYKHVLTNSIGCMQSQWCPNVFKDSDYLYAPYQLSKLSKVAVNGCRAAVEELGKRLEARGYDVLMYNTDGIWYIGGKMHPYHDENEGTGLGQWKTDHVATNFCMRSAGCYQYVEDGVCHTVARGIYGYDAIESDRSKWEYGIIMNNTGFDVKTYKFKKGIGVIKSDEY